MNLGDFPTGAVIPFTWNSQGHDGTATSVTSLGTLRVYKNNSTTERSSLAGITSTLDFDATTGLNFLRVDTTDNTDAGFYAAGNEYAIVLVGTVIDGTTVTTTLAHFSIERPGGALALLKSGTFGLSALQTAIAALPTAVWASGTRSLTTFGTLVSDMTTAVWAAGTRSLTTLGTLVADVATAVWGASVRSLSTFGFTVTLATSPWDESASGHDTAGTMGQKMNAAGANADPLLNTVPGSYTAGTAGYALGTQANNTAAIAAIEAQTNQLAFSGGAVVSTGGATPAAIAAQVWGTVMESQGSYTAQQVQSILLAVLAGVTSANGTVLKSPNGQAIRVTAVVDALDNRTTMTLTPSA